MGRYQYTAENDDYEADLERIRISRKRRKARNAGQNGWRSWED